MSNKSLLSLVLIVAGKWPDYDRFSSELTPTVSAMVSSLFAVN